MIRKAVVSAFQVIENNLVWKVGNGRKLQIGEDPWLGCKRQHILLDHTIHELRKKGFYMLNQLPDPLRSIPWGQAWKSNLSLGLEGEDAIKLSRYYYDLSRAQVKLRDFEDELIWDSDLQGLYTPR